MGLRAGEGVAMVGSLVTTAEVCECLCWGDGVRACPQRPEVRTSALRGQKRVLYCLELELEEVVSHSRGNQTQTPALN